MGLPIPENDLFSSTLIDLELKRVASAGGALGLKYEVEIRNRVTGAFGVMRARDLPPELQSHVQELVAMIELHAGERFFSTES